MNAANMLRELSKPRPDGEKMTVTIERTARMVGLEFSRCYEIWYRRARRIEPEEVARIGDALDKKTARDARNEFQELRLRLARLESLLVQTDAEFHRENLGSLREGLRRSR